MEIRVVFENTTKYFKLTLQYFNLRFIIFPKYFEIIIDLNSFCALMIFQALKNYVRNVTLGIWFIEKIKSLSYNICYNLVNDTEDKKKKKKEK